MSNADPSTRTARRCETHPRRQAEYACESCGRPLCLTCAVPVRGRILGPECVRVPGLAEEDGAEKRGRHTAFLVAGIGFVIAVAGTILPWSAPNFSHYTGLFGGWGFSPPAWSLVAAVAAASGAGAWFAATRLGSPAILVVWGLPAAAALAAAGAILFMLRPPFATHPWLGPWITLGAALSALAASAVFARSLQPRSTQPGD